MYKVALTFLLFLTIQSAVAQIPNSGFENWVSGNPDGWTTSNITGLVTNVTQSDVPHSGSSAVRGEVAALGLGYVLQPLLQDGVDARGFPYSQRPVSITGYYQFFPTGGDRFAVNVGLYKGGVDGTNIAIAAIADPAVTTSYTQFTATFIYQSAEIPDSCIIQIQIIGPDVSTPQPHLGSYFILDDLAFSSTTSVEAQNTSIPAGISLSQNYPNPFNPSTSIPFSLHKGSYVKLRIFNVLGKEITTLVNGYREAGQYDAKFNASVLPSGVYFYRLEAGNYSATKQMLLVK